MKYQELNYDQYIRGRDMIIAIDEVDFDWEAKLGQARPLDRTILEERRVSIMLNPPAEPFAPMLWEQMPGGPYIALTNQHSIRAAQMYKDKKQLTEALPEWAQFVKGTVLKPETPLEVRKFVAGKFQGQQAAVVGVKLSRCATILLEVHDESPRLPLIEKMGTMIVRSGQPRAQQAVCTLV